MIIFAFWGVHTFIDLMEFCFTCQFGIRPRLTKRNYQKWSALIIDHIRREHKEVFPFLCSKELPSDDLTPVNIIMLVIFFIINTDFFCP